MYRNSILKQVVYFIIGSIINLGMFCLSKYAGFPIWADFAGSLYITALAGPIAGLLSVVLHTVLLVLLIDGSYAIWLAVPAILICALVFLYKIRDIEFSVQNTLALASLSSLISFLSLWLPFEFIGAYGRRTALALLISDGYICAIVAAGTALLEACLTIAVFYIAYLITPKNDEKLIFKR